MLAGVLGLFVSLSVGCERRGQDHDTAHAPELRPDPTPQVPTPTTPGQPVLAAPQQPGQQVPGQVMPAPNAIPPQPMAAPAAPDPNAGLTAVVSDLQRRVQTLEGNVLFLSQQDTAIRTELARTQAELRATQQQMRNMQSQARSVRSQIQQRMNGGGGE